jgi:hypothetical protein
MMMNKRQLADMFKGTSDQKKEVPFKFGVIDPNYLSGRPRVIFDGEFGVSNKEYAYLSSYKPTPNDRVLVCNINGIDVILGKIL